MAKPTGFLEFEREDPPHRLVEERVLDDREVEEPLAENRLLEQAARCMDCGVPFCHAFGCPVKNRVPDWNDMVYKGHWEKALEVSPDQQPAGRADSRAASVPPWARPPARSRSTSPQPRLRHSPGAPDRGARLAGRVDPTGTAGTQAAGGLPWWDRALRGCRRRRSSRRRGHDVVVFEKVRTASGGMLRYGIPDFKLESLDGLDRTGAGADARAEGVVFEQTCVNAGVDVSAAYLRRSFDAIVLAAGTTVPRDLEAPEGIPREFISPWISSSSRTG